MESLTYTKTFPKDLTDLITPPEQVYEVAKEDSPIIKDPNLNRLHSSDFEIEFSPGTLQM